MICLPMANPPRLQHHNRPPAPESLFPNAEKSSCEADSESSDANAFRHGFLADPDPPSDRFSPVWSSLILRFENARDMTQQRKP